MSNRRERMVRVDEEVFEQLKIASIKTRTPVNKLKNIRITVDQQADFMEREENDNRRRRIRFGI